MLVARSGSRGGFLGGSAARMGSSELWTAVGRLEGNLQSQRESGYIFMSSHFHSPDPLMKIWHFALSYPLDKTSSSLSSTNAELQSRTTLFTPQHPYMVQMI
jgi:hypothetical protein